MESYQRREFRIVRLWLLWAVVLLPIPALSAEGLAAGCSSLGPESVKNAQAYIAKRLNRDPHQIIITVGPPLPDRLCFSRLTIIDTVNQETFSLFLSSDSKILTSELYEIGVDSISKNRNQEDRNQEDPSQLEKLARLLRDGDDAGRGVANSPVEIVVFMDFQCPFCRRMNDVLEPILSRGDPKVQVIYRAYPLDFHPWAMEAATLAACVQLQNTDAFWNLNDNLFEHQSDITTQTLRPRVEKWLWNDNNIDRAKLNTCIASGQGKMLVDRDVALGKKVGVEATPTSFVNGVRLEGVSSEDKLLDLIRNAKDETRISNSLPIGVRHVVSTESGATQ